MSSAVVVLSGGQDSTTCLFLAKAKHERVRAISFDYGQRHAVELESAKRIAKLAGVPHDLVDLRGYGSVAKSALTDRATDVSATGGLGGLPSTFTPGRNLVFLTVAASYAIAHGADTLVTGVCETDYSGYPDCRRTTIDALQVAIALGNDLRRFTIETPLMYLTKRQTVELARSLPGCWEALALTVTCYQGQVPGCGSCPACELRAKGFESAGFLDPAIPTAHA